jgi:hypothetical protein
VPKLMISTAAITPKAVRSSTVRQQVKFVALDESRIQRVWRVASALAGCCFVRSDLQSTLNDAVTPPVLELNNAPWLIVRALETC